MTRARQHNHESEYQYPLLNLYGAVSSVLALLTLLAGSAAVFVAMRSAESDGAALGSALWIGSATAVIALAIGVGADLVRWMHDIVNLLDEQNEYLHDNDLRS